MNSHDHNTQPIMSMKEAADAAEKKGIVPPPKNEPVQEAEPMMTRALPQSDWALVLESLKQSRLHERSAGRDTRLKGVLEKLTQGSDFADLILPVWPKEKLDSTIHTALSGEMCNFLNRMEFYILISSCRISSRHLFGPVDVSRLISTIKPVVQGGKIPAAHPALNQSAITPYQYFDALCWLKYGRGVRVK